jgi:biotin synthase
MKIDTKVAEILAKAAAGESLNKQECVTLLSTTENSREAFATRAAAAALLREKNGNTAVICGQIGVEAAPCEVDCAFCSFGKSHTSFTEMKLSDEEIAQKVQEFCKDDDLYGLYLMTMHKFNLDNFLRIVSIAKKYSGRAKLIANVGDLSREEFRAMKKAGVDGVYHVCRLGEGKDTKLDPVARLKTMEEIKAAGLELGSCVEPIGPEHTPEEIIEQMFSSLERGCLQTGAMRRVAVPGTPLAHYGQITEFRLSQVVAVLALAVLPLSQLPRVAVHEPNGIGCVCGADMVFAESGVNPRDNAADTAGHRGVDVSACRKMLYEAGYTALLRGDSSPVPLTADYIAQCEVSN